MSRTILLVAILLAGLALFAAPAEASATVFTVNTFDDLPDANPGDGICGTRKLNCSLRAAIQESNAFCGGSYGCEETIELPAGTFGMTRAGQDDTALRGDLDITGHVTIRGAGAAKTFIDGNGNATGDRIFHLIGHPQVTFFVNIYDLSMYDGRSERGGGIYNQGMSLELNASQILYSVSTNWGGGGIYSDGGRVDLYGSVLAYNEALGTYGFGGGLYGYNADTFVDQTTVLANRADGNFGEGGGIMALGGTVVLSKSAVVDNFAADYGGGLNISNGQLIVTESDISGNYATLQGGGIVVGTVSTLRLEGGRVSDNMADPNLGEGGGGIYLRGDSAEIIASELAGNVARRGGAIYQSSGATTIGQTTIDGNDAIGPGGGIYLGFGDMDISQSAISGNGATSSGGGLYVGSYSYPPGLTLSNSTISGNTAGVYGGGLYVDNGGVRLYSATVAANIADSDEDTRGAGGGIFNMNGSVTAENSLVADNARPDGGGLKDDDCHGKLESAGYNLVEWPGGCVLTGDLSTLITHQDPQLAPLDDNGGPTRTHKIPLESVAVEAGNPAGCAGSGGALLDEDQRGHKRHMDGDGDQVDRCDLGAYENGDGMWPYGP
jgi:CSLREA domain-containing protein